MKYALAILSSLSIACALPATVWAHGSTQPQHGGVVELNGETLFELVRAPSGVTLYVVDDDEPVTASAMTAKLSVNIAGQRQDILMVSGAGNQFTADGLTLPKGVNLGVLVVSKASQAHYGTTFMIH